MTPRSARIAGSNVSIVSVATFLTIPAETKYVKRRLAAWRAILIGATPWIEQMLPFPNVRAAPSLYVGGASPKCIEPLLLSGIRSNVNLIVIERCRYGFNLKARGICLCSAKHRHHLRCDDGSNKPHHDEDDKQLKQSEGPL